MTPLRQRLLDDLRLRNYSPRTVQAYVAAVAKLARHFRTAPDRLAPEQVRAFQLHLVGQRVSFSQLNQVTAGLRFFYAVTLGRPTPHLRSRDMPADDPRAFRRASIR